ncbi:MAG TPA: hypothetical protein VNA25_15325 [Phycisphaerae bacterium]|nr:hypothetical protein [Phycisphaerae bacterium]
MPPLFIVLVAILIIGIAVSGWYAAQRRKKALWAWASARGLRFDADHRGNLDARFPEFDCLGKGRDRYGYNVMSGDWQGREFLGFDYHYVTGSGKNRSTHRFSAVILKSPVPLEPLFIRPEGLFDKVTEFFGYDDIDFESAEFSRRFYVKARNKRWAYDVIHPRTMELLLSSPACTIKFGLVHVMAYRLSRFRLQDFEAAAELIRGILDGLPDYVVRQQTGQS